MNTFQLNILERAAARYEKLSSWELDFVESLLERADFEEDLELTDKQNAIINKLASKI